MLNNFMDPAILFFIFGVGAGLVKSNLEIPQPISKFLSLYLLMALGLKGGFALSQSGLTLEVAKGLGAALCLAIVVPLMGYQVLKKIAGPYDAAAIAATYGSVSAVTFMTSVQFLDTQQVPYSGHMSAAMAVMESPAILLAVIWVNALRSQAQSTPHPHSFKQTLHESLTDGAQLLLLGAMQANDGAFFGRPVQRHAGLFPSGHGLEYRQKLAKSEGSVAMAFGLRHPRALHPQCFGAPSKHGAESVTG